MRPLLLRSAIIVVLAAAALPANAFAQARVPAEDTFAVGGDFGVFVPSDQYESSLMLDGYGEFYLTPRVSLRGLVGWTDPEFDVRDDTHARHVWLGLNLLYNWEGGAWHPFVTAGFGAYFLGRHRDGRSVADTENEAGFNLGGGLEYFTARTVSIKGEAAYHIIDDAPGIPDPGGLGLTIGLKKYF